VYDFNEIVKRRHKQLLCDLKKKRGNWKLKEEALDCTVWRTALEAAVDLSQNRLYGGDGSAQHNEKLSFFDIFRSTTFLPYCYVSLYTDNIINN
jgi:hypothetical protein